MIDRKEFLGDGFCAFGEYVALENATEGIAAARGLAADDDRVKAEVDAMLNAEIIAISSHPNYRSAGSDIWGAVLDGVAKAVRDLQAAAKTGPEIASKFIADLFGTTTEHPVHICRLCER